MNDIEYRIDLCEDCAYRNGYWCNLLNYTIPHASECIHWLENEYDEGEEDNE